MSRFEEIEYYIVTAILLFFLALVVFGIVKSLNDAGEKNTIHAQDRAMCLEIGYTKVIYTEEQVFCAEPANVIQLRDR
jgi:hypothetical protein